MTVQGWGQIVVYAAVLVALRISARRLDGPRLLAGALPGSGRAGVLPARRLGRREQDWKGYGKTLLVFSVVFSLLLYAIQRLQGHLFLNPDRLKGVSPHIALNTEASFVTNTNWQYYGGEYTMSYLTQMAGLAVQNFVSAAVGMAVLVAVVRGLARRSAARSATSGSTCTARSSTSCCRWP